MKRWLLLLGLFVSLLAMLLAWQFAPCSRPTAEVQVDEHVVTNALVGQTEAEILARNGRPSSDESGYQRLGLTGPSHRTIRPVRTLVFNNCRGGTEWVWLKKCGSEWVCFESCWYSKGVVF